MAEKKEKEVKFVKKFELISGAKLMTIFHMDKAWVAAIKYAPSECRFVGMIREDDYKKMPVSAEGILK